MFGRLTTMGLAQGASRQICPKLVANFASQQLSNAACTVNVRYLEDLKKPYLLKQRSPALRESSHGSVSRHFASKATSKFGKKVKRETFDRYLGMDPTRLQNGFESISELEDASEDVRRIFSLEFAPGREIRKVREVDTLDDVGIDPTDRGYSNLLVTSIARLTVAIRHLAPHVERFTRDKKNKRLMLMMLDRRRKHIKFLRRTNFDLANRLLEKLNLEFTPASRYSPRQTKRSVEKATFCQQAFTERQRALEEFTGDFREEQLREIAELKRELGMELTDEETGRL